MKEINLHGNSYITPLHGTSEWYYAIDLPHGDLYEAKELFEHGTTIHCSSLQWIHYPDGRVYSAEASRNNCYHGVPHYYNGKIYYLFVDFSDKKIFLSYFDCFDCQEKILTIFSMEEIPSFHNLLLHSAPLMLTLQSDLVDFKILWPEQIEFPVSKNEVFLFRKENLLYFSTWWENSDGYHEEIVIRSLPDGSLLRKIPGAIEQMPNGELWYLH